MSDADFSPPLPKWLRLLPAVYLLVGLIWIVGSDLILERLLRHDLEALVYAGTLKGALFVILTAALLYIAISTSRGPGEQLARVLPSMTPGKPLTAFLLVGLGIAATGYVVYLLEAGGLRERSARQLAAAAETTAHDITQWREARHASMEQVAASPFTGSALADWRRDGSAQLAALLVERLTAIRDHNAFDAASFTTATGAPLITVGDIIDTSAPELRAAILGSTRSGSVTALVLTRGEGTAPISEQIVFVVPLADRHAADPGFGYVLVATVPVDAALLRVRQPGSTGFATLFSSIVRRGNDDTVFLQRITDAGTRVEAMRTPVDGLDTLAARALSTDRAPFRAVDHLDRPVLAVSRAVPGTPYFAVAGIETREIQQQMRRVMFLIGGMSALGFLAAGALVLPWWLVERARTASMLQLVHSRAEELATRLDWVTRHANDVILLLDERGQIIDANDRALETYGYASPELLSMGVFQLRSDDPAEHAAARAQFDTVLQRGSIVFEATHVRKDGTEFPVEVSSRCVTLRDKRYVQSIVRDITQRREVERKLRESEAQYRILFQSNPHPMWVYDPQSLRFLAVNDAAVAQYGYTGTEFMSMTLADIRPAEDVSRLETDVREHAKDVLQHSGIWRHRRKDGSLLNVEIVSHSLEFDGRPARLVLATDITARLRAETALRTSEERYRNLFEHASDGILVLDSQNHILDLNAEMEGLTGRARGELRGRDLTDILDPKEHDRLAKETARLRRGTPPGPEIWLHMRKDGATFPGEVRIRVLPGGELLATVRDLTEILSARHRVERQRDLYDLLSQCNQAIVQTADQHSLFSRLCRLAVERGRFRFACVAEVRPDGGVVPVARFGDELDCDVAASLVSEAASTGRPVIINHFPSDRRFRRGDGGQPSNGVRAVAALPLQTRAGVTGVLTLYGREAGDFDPEISATLQEVAADVSHALDALNTRRELEENRLLLQSIINASDALIYAFDTEGRAILMNEAGARAIGSGRGMLIGRTRQEMMPAEIARVHAANDQQVIRSGTPLIFEERGVDSGLERVYLSVKSPLRDVEGRIHAVGGISTDITELRRVQRELAVTNASLEERVAERTREAVAARERAEAADRAKSLFLSSMSHELRSPLHSIIGFTSVLLEGLEGELTTAQQEHLRVVADASQHLLAIINDLLDMSRIETGAMSLEANTVSVGNLLRRIMRRFRLHAETKGLELTLVEETGAVTIVGDERRIEQIISNLVSNAIKFTDKGHVLVTSRVDGTTLRIEVRDTGPGITTEDQARLFRYFSQIAPAGGRLSEGTGLGLAIARGLAEAMGGRVDLESEPGRGSAFVLVLPTHAENGNPDGNS